MANCSHTINHSTFTGFSDDICYFSSSKVGHVFVKSNKIIFSDEPSENSFVACGR